MAQAAKILGMGDSLRQCDFCLLRSLLECNDNLAGLGTLSSVRSLFAVGAQAVNPSIHWWG
jgi:hypothetical protein